MAEVARTLQVRLAEPAEYPAIGELTVAAYESNGEPLGDYVHELRDVAGRAGSADVLVAIDADRIVGAVTYVPDRDSRSAEFDDPDAASIRFLAVHPEAQRRGVGRALLDACIERARQRGRARIVLHATSFMRASQRMYQQAGFIRHPAMDWLVEDGPLLLGFRLEVQQPTAP